VDRPDFGKQYLSASRGVRRRKEKAAMLIHDFSARLATGEERRFADYRDKVLLIVNVASKCGFTPQYSGLQPLYEQLRPRALKSLLSHVTSSAIRSRGQTRSVRERKAVITLAQLHCRETVAWAQRPFDLVDLKSDHPSPLSPAGSLNDALRKHLAPQTTQVVAAAGKERT
jgi:hypothetical protein